MPAGGSSISPDSQETSRRIQRIPLACDYCRVRKVKCDGTNPCSGCRRAGQKCIFHGRRKRRSRKEKDNLSSSTATPTLPSLDHSLKTGRKPALNDPVHFKKQRELRAGFGVSDAATGSFQFYGPSSHFCFIQRIYQRINRHTNESTSNSAHQEAPSANGVEKWGLERFMFSFCPDDQFDKCSPQAYISAELGTRFIECFFEIVHPQIPVLNYEDITASWKSMWQPPRVGCETKKGDEILYMVLALGAHLYHSDGQQDLKLSEGWSEHFHTMANKMACGLADTSLRSTHYMLLKSFYAFQVMKSNDAYIYLGHAARNALALGIHRAQVVDGDNLAMHRVRIAFWTIYVYERSCSLFSGRPSSFRDEMIDAPYPSDIPNTISSEQSTTHQHLQPTYRCAWIRSMSQLGKISDRIFVEIYSCQAMVTPHDILKVRQSTISCDSELQAITHTLPTYLHFFDPSTPIGEGWQEVQRIMMGVHYYIVRMLLHRQALVFTTLFDSQSDAEDCSSGIMQISDSIEISVQSAESLINLAHDVFFHRHPSMKFDGSVATLLVSACITLLFYLLGHKFNPEDVRKKFAIVEKGIRCLDQLQHIGPTSGKAISQDIMKVAKDAYLSIENQPSDLLPFQMLDMQASEGTDFSQLESILTAPDVNYMSHWLEAGFQQEEIPDCLF